VRLDVDRGNKTCAEFVVAPKPAAAGKPGLFGNLVGGKKDKAEAKVAPPPLHT
jgi:hypothetical protein